MTPKKIKGYRHLPAFLLLTLAHGPGHGGALMTRMSEILPMRKVDSAAVYRTLASLEEDGEIEGRWDTSAKGPAKKIYCLTERGLERLQSWREDMEYRIELLTTFLNVADTIAARPKESIVCNKH